MTIDEFIERLSKTRRKWFLLHNRYIRAWLPIWVSRSDDPLQPASERLSCCPITGVRRYAQPADRYLFEAADMGLTRKDAAMIVNAADCWGSYSRPLRKRLLAACRLSEKWKDLN